jgi:hypothetical protein
MLVRAGPAENWHFRCRAKLREYSCRKAENIRAERQINQNNSYTRKVYLSVESALAHHSLMRTQPRNFSNFERRYHTIRISSKINQGPNYLHRLNSPLVW